MPFIYFWLFFPTLCCFSTVQGSGGGISRSNEVFYRDQQQKHHGVAKYVDGKYPNTAWNSSKRLFGRHVCTQSKVVMVPVKDVQSYCKPMYQSYLRPCDKEVGGYCTGYRVVYELAYRSVQMLMPKTESQYTCCPGWTRTQVYAEDCKRAICRDPCKNGGICTKPDQCLCPPGWTGKTCETDVDECSRRRHACEHECINVHGSYKCSCRDGFILQEDRRSCKNDRDSYEISLSGSVPDCRFHSSGQTANCLTELETNNSEDTSELLKKIDSLQQRLIMLEEWQRRMTKHMDGDKSDSRSPREDRINSLSEQMAIIEETLEECSCFRKNSLPLPQPQR